MANTSRLGKNPGLVLFIGGDSTALNKELEKASRNVTAFSKQVQTEGAKTQAAISGGFLGGSFGRGSKFNQGLRGLASGTGLGSAALFGSGPFIGAALSAGALKKSVDAASNLNEQITKTDRVFGQSSKTIQDWAKTTSRSIFISREAALQAASTFGNLFKAQGFGDVENSKLSKGLVNLAGDLASFNNVDVTQVLQDLQSGIVGEIEPVRKYGADLRIARVQQEALAESGKDTVKQLTQQELTLARLHLLYKDTAAAQGDAARTAGGFANQERKLSAQVSDLAANLGTLLLPAVTGIVTGLNDLASVAIAATGALQKLAQIKIPSIHIPLLFDIGGGKVGGGLGSFLAKTAGVASISPAAAAFEIVKKVHDEISGSVKKATTVDTPKLASDFQDAFSPYFSSAINQAVRLKGFIKLPRGNAKKQFGSLIDALNLDLSRADLTAARSDNISILKDLVTAYKAEIRAGIDVKNAQKNLIATKKALQEEVSGAASDRFSNLIDSLDLGIERSQINGSLQQQLAALEALKAGYERQIKAGVDVKSAQHGLASTMASIVDLQKQIKQEGIDKIMEALQLGVDQASLTKGLGDDLKALEAQRDGIKAQIKAGNDIASNQSKLVSVLGEIQSVREQLTQNAKDVVKANLFKQIGLSAAGGEVVPGVANLKKQFDQLKSQDLSDVTKKLTNRLAGVGKALANPILKSLPEVRSAIKDLFAAIRDELNKQGPLTKTTALNTNKILKGLGLDPEAAKALRARLSKFNSAGVALSGTGVAALAGGVPIVGGVPQVSVDVSLDGEKITKNVTVRQGKRSRRNPPQKRGPQAGRF